MTTGESATARWCALQSPAADARQDLNVRRGAAWACDDGIDATLNAVGESLCDVVDLRAGWKVLDIGNGTCSGAAARPPAMQVTHVASSLAVNRHDHWVMSGFAIVATAGRQGERGCV